MATQNNKDKSFFFELVVTEIDSVKPRPTGSFQNQEGKTISYPDAVKFKTRNLELIDDEDFGVKEKETTLEVLISCDSKEEMIELNKFLLGLKVDKKTFNIPTTLPTGEKDEYSCKSLITGASFISNNKK